MMLLSLVGQDQMGVNTGEWFVSSLEDLPEGHEKMSFDELYRLRRERLNPS